MSFDRFDRTDTSFTQPETVVTLLRQLGVRDASGAQIADILRAWLHDNVPNRALRVSIRGNGYGTILDQRFGRLRMRGAHQPRALQG